LNEQLPFVEVDCWRVRLNDGGTGDEECGLIFLFHLSGMSLLVFLFLPALVSPVPTLAAVATLIFCDITGPTVPGTATAAIACITSTMVTTVAA
jgi:hypothetical protein